MEGLFRLGRALSLDHKGSVQEQAPLAQFYRYPFKAIGKECRKNPEKTNFELLKSCIIFRLEVNVMIGISANGS